MFLLQGYLSCDGYAKHTLVETNTSVKDLTDGYLSLWAQLYFINYMVSSIRNIVHN